VVNELLKPYNDMTLFRRSALEYALELSIYNFDIMLELLKIYDMQGCSFGFSEMMTQLTQKGVQHETMGFLQFRFSTNWQDPQVFKSYLKKFKKYDYKNKLDLKSVKGQALKLANYEQLEKVIEYESYINRSYYSQNLLNFQEMLFDFSDSY
jgi:hypothetical protein